MCFHYRKASIASSRSHPSLFITNTEKKSSHETSPFTTGELRSSSTRSHPSNPARNRINKDTKPNPKTELGNQKPATQGKERLHPPESKAGDCGAGEASTSRRQGRRRRSCRNLHLPESKLNLTSRLHHTKTLHTIASLLQTQSHHWCWFTPRIDDDEWGLDQSSDKAVRKRKRKRSRRCRS